MAARMSERSERSDFRKCPLQKLKEILIRVLT